MDFASRLFWHAPVQAVERNAGQLVETGAPGPVPSIPQPSEASLTDDAADLAEDEELSGLPDLRAAVRMVASGAAISVTICGFPDGHGLLRVGRELAIEGLEVGPLIRSASGGFDIRVRQVPFDIRVRQVPFDIRVRQVP